MHPYTAYVRLYHYYHAGVLSSHGIVDALFAQLYSRDSGPVSSMGYINPERDILSQFGNQPDNILSSGCYIDELNELMTDDMYATAISFASQRMVSANRGYLIDGYSYHQPPGSIFDEPSDFSKTLTDYLSLVTPKYECLFDRLSVDITDASFTYDAFMASWQHTDALSPISNRFGVMGSRLRFLVTSVEMLDMPFVLADEYTPRVIVQTIVDYLRSFIDYFQIIKLGKLGAMDIIAKDLHKMNQLLE
jgi:hypothetical protein